MTAPYSNVPLYDVGFEYLPKISSKYCDILLMILSLYFTLRWLFVDMKKLRDFLRIMSWVFLIRICCFSSTTVPFPTNECNSRKVGDPIVWNVFPYLWDNHTNSCYDLMFSGHAAHVSLIMLFTIIYTSNCIEKWLVFISTLTCYICIIASQIHYTHDVIVGVAISIPMFGTYFSARMCPFFYPKNN
jgi:hypothetical protein